MEISKANGQLDTALANLNQRTSGIQQAGSDAQAEKNQSQGGDERQQEGLSEKLADIAQKLNEQMDSLDTNVRFGYSDKINSMYISVTEKSTGREIRQIPSEEAMRLAEYFRDVIGMIFDKES
ncbi:flagellar protein FlaG [Campylobacter coli]|uniref:Flagellar biosynthesis protein FlaG n=1 Tax=Campylobacter jejuni TaxID=197 RepID=A0A6F9MUX0_CAMJU|nr:flagellar protein FlaG [Campylobacter coli]EAJ7021468.1 flagellar protein FlaG [Campylobacter coli]EAW0593711.1 flagellar protein FlaG [Campylobacter coli]EGS0794947.1 flagellar protein FlaG [Campylobacter coli]ELJ5538217.1 flagella length regulator FlaG [Campylobacter coli]